MISVIDFITPYSEQELRSLIYNTFIVNESLHISKKYNLTSIDWTNISAWQTLSEDFIREFQDKVDWHSICRSQTLSEDFILEFQDVVNWYDISNFQKLSEFIRKFQDKVNWYYISRNLTLELSDKFCEEFDKKLNIDKCCVVNGKYHRTLGPANDRNEYWYRVQYAENVNSMKQYKRWLKLRAFI